MSERRRYWLAIVDPEAARRLARSRWTALAVPPTDARPDAADRIDILVTHRPRFVVAARVVANVDVLGANGTELRTRHRFVAPEGHEPVLSSLGMLVVAAGWTDAILAGLVGSVIPIGARDHLRIDGALRDVALAFGPEPSRPHHRRPRTPGRRALLEGRTAWPRTYPAR